MGVSSVARWTFTSWYMTKHGAESMRPAVARINATLVFTGQMLRTLAVRGALRTNALHQCVSAERWRAVTTSSVVVVWAALGIFTTASK